jgi:uncharacterized membrane protein YsdA (DUF1294 family)
MAARRAWRRVPEATLLAFGVLGGWAGAIAGQQLFRHKTQKQPFRTRFIISTIVSLRDGGDLFVLSFFFSLSSGEATVCKRVECTQPAAIRSILLRVLLIIRCTL